jgi:hypothetical protein
MPGSRNAARFFVWLISVWFGGGEIGVLYIGVLYLIFYGGFGKIGLRFANLAL